jgi:hypothetical protein
MRAYTKTKQVFDPKTEDTVNDLLDEGWRLISITVKRLAQDDGTEFTDYPTYILGMPEPEDRD